MQIKELYLKKFHENYCARFGEFANTNMPIMYRMGVLKEHLHVRENVGLFDISHMQIIEVSGQNATNYLEHCLPLDLTNLAIYNSKYSFLLNESAGIIDDLIITKLDNDHYYLVVNASNAEKDFKHLLKQKSNKKFNKVELCKLERVILALQGPKAANILKNIFLDIELLSFMQAALSEDGIFISRSGYTGEDGFELAIPLELANDIAYELVNICEVELIGLAARDSLRLEAGLCLHGNDIDENTNPVEAGLLWAIPKYLRTSKAKYIGAAVIENIINNPPLHKRVGFLPIGKQPVRGGATIHNAEGKQIGRITSGSFGASVNAPISMGYIEKEYIANSSTTFNTTTSTIYALQRGKKIDLLIKKLPFVEHNYYIKKHKRNQMVKIYYTKEHEWLRIEGDVATVGITDYAQNQLGELVFVELPGIGEEYISGEPVVVVESVKAASDVYAPISGTIIAINEALNDDPSLVNTKAETEGWMWKMDISNSEDLEVLLDLEAYNELL